MPDSYRTHRRRGSLGAGATEEAAAATTPEELAAGAVTAASHAEIVAARLPCKLLTWTGCPTQRFASHAFLHRATRHTAPALHSASVAHALGAC